MVGILDSVRQGQSFADGLFETQARRTAGAALAQGDYGAAAGALYRQGDLQGGAGIQRMQEGAQDRQTAQTERERLRQLTTTRQVITALSRAAEAGDDVGLLLEEFRPTFAAMGTPAEEYDRIAAQVRANPTILDQFGAIIDRDIQVVNTGNGGWASIDKDTGQRVAGESPQFPLTVANGVALTRGGDVAFDARTPDILETQSGGAPVALSVDPRTGQVREVWRGEAAPREQFTTLSADEVQALGLAPGVYQRSAAGEISTVSGQGPRQLSAGQARQVEQYEQQIETASAINDSLGQYAALIQNRTLPLSTLGNAWRGARNFVGASTAESQLLATFRSDLERLRNESLRLNSGVQTEGDAQRAWNELITNINDDGVVLAQIQRIQALNERAIEFRRRRVDAIQGTGAQPQTQPTTRQRPAPGQFPLANGTPEQVRAWSALGLGTGALGSRTNPRPLNPTATAQSYNNAPSGSYFINARGEIVGPKP